jgi:hypothetical protein
MKSARTAISTEFSSFLEPLNAAKRQFSMVHVGSREDKPCESV